MSWQTALSSNWRSVPSGPFFDESDAPAEFLEGLPDDYLLIAGEHGGREGFLGEEYLRLYRLNELLALNVAFDVPERLSGLVLFGSNGCGEAFAFPVGEAGVMQVPFIPMVADCAKVIAVNFGEFVSGLASTGPSRELNPAALGTEVHEINPICFGGDPTDPKNKILVSPAKLAELSRFWTKVYVRAVSGN